jgi:hypothetical protein
MIVTEEQAKLMWCPDSSVAMVAGMAANRTAAMGTGGYADITNETRCIASDCMAWRESHGEGPARGYCGRAGKP